MKPHSDFLTISLLIDFPTETMGQYRGLSPEMLGKGLRDIHESMNGDYWMSKPLGLFSLYTDGPNPTSRLTDGFLPESVVGYFVDRGLGAYHDDVNTKLAFEMTGQNVVPETKEWGSLDPIQSYLAYGKEEAEAETPRKFSCVRWEWKDGVLSVRYNYVVSVVDESASPALARHLEELQPQFSVMARYWITPDILPSLAVDPTEQPVSAEA